MIDLINSTKAALSQFTVVLQPVVAGMGSGVGLGAFGGTPPTAGDTHREPSVSHSSLSFKFVAPSAFNKASISSSCLFSPVRCCKEVPMLAILLLIIARFKHKIRLARGGRGVFLLPVAHVKKSLISEGSSTI